MQFEPVNGELIIHLWGKKRQNFCGTFINIQCWCKEKKYGVVKTGQLKSTGRSTSTLVEIEIEDFEFSKQCCSIHTSCSSILNSCVFIRCYQISLPLQTCIKKWFTFVNKQNMGNRIWGCSHCILVHIDYMYLNWNSS